MHRVEEGGVDWFWLDGGTYVRQRADTGGRLHSRVFPGLVLDVAALLRQDLLALRTGVEQAVRTAEHAAFAQRVQTTERPS